MCLVLLFIFLLTLEITNIIDVIGELDYPHSSRFLCSYRDRNCRQIWRFEPSTPGTETKAVIWSAIEELFCFISCGNGYRKKNSLKKTKTKLVVKIIDCVIYRIRHPTYRNRTFCSGAMIVSFL